MKKLLFSIFTIVLMLCFVTCSEPTPKVYTIAFDSQEGSYVASKQVTEGSTVEQPVPDPTKDGYSFSGWYKDSSCTGSSYDFSTPVTSSFTLYAKWTEISKNQKWCVMNYFDFSNLTSYALYNLDEICQSVPNDNVKAYFITGGASTSYSLSRYTYLSKAIQAFNPSDPFGPSAKADTYQLWEYTSDGKFKEIASAVKGMNDSDVLSQFVEQCLKMAKSADPDAEYKYILELWDHGGGSYAGLVLDYAVPPISTEGAIMSLADCGNAIKNVTKKNGFKFEVVIFDMCLMQSIESAHSVSYSAANYIVGSQTSSAAEGSAYTDWYNYLYQHPNATGLEFGKAFCDTAYAKIVDSGSSAFIENITWSVLDMSKLAALESAYEAYAASYLASVSASAVETCVKKIDRMSAFSTFWEYYMYDINVFTSTLGGSSAASSLLSAVRNAIAYKKYGTVQAEAGCCGLSMCVLTNNSDWKSKWKYSQSWNDAYLEYCLTPNYRTFQQKIANGL